MKILYYCGWLVGRIGGKLLFRIKVTGEEHIPATGGFILASNHISYYDPLLLGSWSTRQMYFFAKAELFRNKLFGSLISRTNAIPVKRGTIDRGAVDRALQAIGAGFGLVMFPEGTRSKTGDFLGPKAGLGMLAMRAQCPVVPAYVHGADKLKSCFWGHNQLTISFGAPVGIDHIRTIQDTKEGFEELSKMVMSRIAALKTERLGTQSSV